MATRIGRAFLYKQFEQHSFVSFVRLPELIESTTVCIIHRMEDLLFSQSILGIFILAFSSSSLSLVGLFIDFRRNYVHCRRALVMPPPLSPSPSSSMSVQLQRGVFYFWFISFCLLFVFSLLALVSFRKYSISRWRLSLLQIEIEAATRMPSQSKPWIFHKWL